MSTRNNAHTQPAGAARDLKIPYVLIADAHLQRAAACFESIKPFNLGVLVARDGDEAIRVIERFGPPILLIVDLSLCRKDGFAVIETLRGVDRERTEIIAWSAFRELREFAAHRLTGLNVRILGGAVAPAVLSGAIERTLQRRTETAASPRTSSQPDAEDVYQTMKELTEKARLVSGTAGVAVYLRVLGETQFRASVTWTSDAPIPHSPYYLPRVFGRILETGEALVLPDLATQPLSDVSTSTLQDVVRGLVAVPIVSPDQQLIGTICVFDLHPLTLGSGEVDALKALGRGVSVGLPLPSVAAGGRDPSQRLPASPESLPDESPGWPNFESPTVKTDHEGSVHAAGPQAGVEAGDRSLRDPVSAGSHADKSDESPEFVWPPEPGDVALGPSGESGNRPLRSPAPLATPTQDDSESHSLDSLGALLDRRGGAFAFARELSRARREKRQLSVVLFEIGSLNGTDGATDGADSLLRAVGETLTKTIRGSDLIIRWSGDELLAVLPGLSALEARPVAERLRAAMQAGVRHRVAVAGGVADLTAGDTLASIVAGANEKVRLAREHGHNRVA